MNETQTPKMPDVTPVQIIAQIPAIVAIAVAFGWLDDQTAQGVVAGIGALVTVTWMLADVFIRRGRANVFAAQQYAPAFAAGKIAQGGPAAQSTPIAAKVADTAPEVSELPDDPVEDDLPPADGA